MLRAMKRGLVTILIGLAACATEDNNELAAHQGVCNALGEAACKSTTSCQEAYWASYDSMGSFPLRCLLLQDGPASTAACDSLSHDACRSRSDCSPFYWQELGPGDEPVGDPSYKRCETETEISGP